MDLWLLVLLTAACQMQSGKRLSRLQPVNFRGQSMGDVVGWSGLTLTAAELTGHILFLVESLGASGCENAGLLRLGWIF